MDPLVAPAERTSATPTPSRSRTKRKASGMMWKQPMFFPTSEASVVGTPHKSPAATATPATPSTGTLKWKNPQRGWCSGGFDPSNPPPMPCFVGATVVPDRPISSLPPRPKLPGVGNEPKIKRPSLCTPPEFLNFDSPESLLGILKGGGLVLQLACGGKQNFCAAERNAPEKASDATPDRRHYAHEKALDTAAAFKVGGQRWPEPVPEDQARWDPNSTSGTLGTMGGVHAMTGSTTGRQSESQPAHPHHPNATKQPSAQHGDQGEDSAGFWSVVADLFKSRASPTAGGHADPALSSDPTPAAPYHDDARHMAFSRPRIPPLRHNDSELSLHEFCAGPSTPTDDQGLYSPVAALDPEELRPVIGYGDDDEIADEMLLNLYNDATIGTDGQKPHGWDETAGSLNIELSAIELDAIELDELPLPTPPDGIGIPHPADASGVIDAAVLLPLSPARHGQLEYSLITP